MEPTPVPTATSLIVIRSAKCSLSATFALSRRSVSGKGSNQTTFPPGPTARAILRAMHPMLAPPSSTATPARSPRRTPLQTPPHNLLAPHEVDGTDLVGEIELFEGD